MVSRPRFSFIALAVLTLLAVARPSAASVPAAVSAGLGPADASTVAGPAQEEAAAAAEDGGVLQAVNDFFAPVDRFWGEWINGPINWVFFHDLWFWDNDEPVIDPKTGQKKLDAEGNVVTDPVQLPLAVLWLIVGAVFFTFRMGFINLRGFKHAIDVTRGKYSNPQDEGEVSHFQALTAALSATVGLGNIAGVAIAISVGGPGATFWMILAGLLGMSSKFTECTLGQMYREVRPDGRVMGGAMFYLSKGLNERGLPGFGRFLALVFSLLCIGGSLAGGNAFQVSQSMNALGENIPIVRDYPWIYGLALSFMVGVVILGGIRRIAATAEKIVPFMCGIYVLASLFILFDNYHHIPAAFSAIVTGAFSMKAGLGGALGVLVTGFQRAAFSNEAGAGSAAIAHSAARTPHPTREGIVALLEPFIDTVVVCTMTALVIVITGAYDNPAYEELRASTQGAALTSRAFGEHIAWFPYVLSVAVVLFAYSTMISWSYYGERCWAYLFGDGSSTSYRLLFIVFVFLGSVLQAGNVLEFGDLMILGMAFPNIFGIYFLTKKVRASLDDYWGKLKRGEYQVYK